MTYQEFRDKNGWSVFNSTLITIGEAEYVQIQRDSLLEAVEIAQRIATESSRSYETYHGAMLVHDAILERSKTLTPHFHSTSGGKNE